MGSIKLSALIKKTGFFVLLAAMVCTASAQTWSEFFRQKKTQRKYLAKQIAALKMYGGYLRQGYEIARDGLSLVHDITGGEFRLHKDYFGSLGAISPVVKGSSDVLAILSVGHEIAAVLETVTGSEYLHPSDKSYLRNVRDGLLEASLDDLDQLLLIITAGKLELTDRERLGQLKKILNNIRRKAALARELAGQARLLVRQRKREQATTEALEEIHQLNL